MTGKVVGESGSRAWWTNELAQLVRGPVLAARRTRAASSLVTALDHCTDIVQVTLQPGRNNIDRVQNGPARWNETKSRFKVCDCR